MEVLQREHTCSGGTVRDVSEHKLRLAVVIYGEIARFYVNGSEVFSTATGNLNLSGNEQEVIQWWNVQSSNDTSSWSNFQLANWG